MTRDLRFPAHIHLPEPTLAFHPADLDRHNAHPLRGLMKYGPFSSSLSYGAPQRIRVATIAPMADAQRLPHLINELQRPQIPRERRDYLPRYPGFRDLFNIDLLSDKVIAEQIPESVDESVANTPSVAPVAVSGNILGALSRLRARRSEFDVVMIYLPQRWHRAFEDRDAGFDLHDHLKAAAAEMSIPIQLVREDKAIAYRCRASVAWRMSIALYVKAGGVPWAVAPSNRATAYVGISYAIRPTDKKFITCCSQIFDDAGLGLEFILYRAAPQVSAGENPFLTREDMRAIMSSSLRLYQDRHAGRLPARLVVHKSTHFTKDEVQGCRDALYAIPQLELLQIQSSADWRGTLLERPKTGRRGWPAAYPLRRGALLPFSRKEALLWTQGNIPEAAGNRDYYPEGKGIPEPLLLRRFLGQEAWPDVARRVLALTKMNWNNDAYYDRLPTTMRYAHVLADVVKRMTRLAPTPYQFRFFM